MYQASIFNFFLNPAKFLIDNQNTVSNKTQFDASERSDIVCGYD